MDSKLEILNRLIKEGKSFTVTNFCLPNDYDPSQYNGVDTPEWSTFKTRVKNIISELVSENSPAMNLVNIGISTRTLGENRSKFDAVIGNLLKALELVSTTVKSDVYGELKSTKSKSVFSTISNKVFVVHGHDQGLKTDIERFLHEIGLVPVVLHREADQGATIIEKFEKHSDVGYAFILLTPDEIGFTVDQESIDDNKRKKEYRARSNVIFEFGYFVGKLGRSKVCCLHKGNVVVPSDLSGLVYKKIDGSIETAAYSIIKELKAAGYNINV